MHINFVGFYTTDLTSLNYFALFAFDYRDIKGFPLPVAALDFSIFDSLCKAFAARK